MKIYPYSIRTFGGRRICIGKQGENLATRIDVDVTPWKTEYPTGNISLFVVPPAGSGYLAALEENGNTIRWAIRDTDTASIGIGKVELILKDADGTVMKSVTAYTTCIPSISADEPADPPEAIRPWVEQILDAIAGGALAGIGIESLEQTTISTDDGGVNVWTATLTDGSTYQFEVRNGQRGATGPQGEPGSIESLKINGKTPDDSGTVTLTPDDLGAATAEEVSQLKSEKVDKSSVVNNYMTTQEGFVADARALKDLNDRMGTPLRAVTSIMLSKKDDWDSVNPGVYYFNTWAYEGGVNYPKGGMGVVMFLKSYDGTYGAQYCISDSWLGVRVCSESEWGAWKYLALA